MTSNVPGLEPGELVAERFRIIKVIGSGGFSVVYLAHHEEMNRQVALKVLKPKASADKSIVERFRREALYASRLSHPNTIRLFDYGQSSDGLFYIAMEYLIGTDLSADVLAGKPVDLTRVWKVLVQTCRSLAEAHRIGLVHRDLKPENIFIAQTPDGEMIKVLDFGVSKTVSDQSEGGPRTLAPLTMDGTVFGTPLYMAPEQAMAEPITPAADVYALGQIAYEMITGRAAYGDSDDAMTVMLRQINEPALELPIPWKSTPFAALVKACTEKNPTLRLQDAAAVLQQLEMPEFYAYSDPHDNSTRDFSTIRLPSIEVSSDPARMRARAESALQRGEYPEAMLWYEKACELYRTLGPARHYVECIAEMGHCASLLKMPRRAEGILLQGLAHAKHLNDPEFKKPGLLTPSTIVRLEYYLGQALVQQARFLEANEYLRRAAAHIELNQYSSTMHSLKRTDLTQCLISLGNSNFSLSCYKEARTDYEQALKVPLEKEHEAMFNEAHIGIIMCLAATDQISKAITYATNSLTHSQARGDLKSFFRLQFILGDLYIASGSDVKAEHCFSDIYHQVHQTARRRLAYDCLIRHAYIEFDRGNDELAYDKLVQAEEFSRKIAFNDGIYAVRAHTIFMQLLANNFNTQGKAFKTLHNSSALEDSTGLSLLLSIVFRIDFAISHGEWKSANQLIQRARLLAAATDDYGIFVSLSVRQSLVDYASEGSKTFMTSRSISVGAAIPPEVSRRCFTLSRIAPRFAIS